jgi:MoaA/NifB/PqqE/SkfB family radical SAM enzyme
MIRTLRSRLENQVLSWINVDRYLPIQIDITNACNLRCVHCYHPHHKNDGAIGLAEWREILAQYDALVARLRFRPYVILCGGEPLLSPVFEPILSSLLSRASKTPEGFGENPGGTPGSASS